MYPPLFLVEYLIIHGGLTLKAGTLFLLPLQIFALTFLASVAFGMVPDMLLSVQTGPLVNRGEGLVLVTNMVVILEPYILIEASIIYIFK